jgi:hypothetical protein
LSINRVLSNNSNPGEISNLQLLIDRREYVINPKNDKLKYCNYPLRNGLAINRDYYLVPNGIWRYLKQRYNGEEIMRYAVYT